MKSNQAYRRSSSILSSLSLDFAKKNSSGDLHEDDISIASLNQELTDGLHSLSANLNNYFSSRRLSNRRSSASVSEHKDDNGSGLIINGSFFDGHLFLPTRSSCIIDYSSTSEDLNRSFDPQHSPTAHLDSHLYKLAFIITLSDWYLNKELLLGYYPYDITTLDEIANYKQFCFPELNPLRRTERSVLDDPATFVFTRTLSDGQVEHGYCRRLAKEHNQITKYPIVICIVSTHPYFKLYDAILNEFANVYISNDRECAALMQSFHSKTLPLPMKNPSSVTCILKNRRLFFYSCPRDERHNHDYYATLLSSLSPAQIIHLFESMLLSKRLLLFSSSPSKLTKCCLALSLLIYPFIWPYSFVSLMPSSWLRDLLDSPCPFIYGCLHETIEHIPSTIDSDTIQIDLDSGIISDETEKSYLLPLNLRQVLEGSLEYLKRFRITKLNPTLVNLAVSEACLHVFTELLYHLPEFFKREQAPMTFALCSDYFTRHDSGIDLQSIGSVESQPAHAHREEANRLGYHFRSQEFLESQSNSSYVTFLKEFIRGMIFLKFLDDYQQEDSKKPDLFPLFSQRLDERRRLTSDDLSINPLLRFRQTIDLLENQMKEGNKQNNPSLSRFLKKIFE